MLQVHHVQHLSVIPVEGLTNKEFFAGIEEAGSNYDRKTIEAGQRTAIRRLRKILPTFIDDKITLYEHQTCRISSGFGYEVLLPHGKVQTYAYVYDDLGKHLSDTSLIRDGPKEKKEEIANLFNGKGGIILIGNYRWNGIRGKKLRLEGPQHYAPRWGYVEKGFADGNNSLPFLPLMVNALWHGVTLNRETVVERTLMQPFQSYHEPPAQNDGSYLEASVRDFSLEALKAGEKTIHQFLAWAQKEWQSISSAGELARLAAESYLSAERNEKGAKRGKVFDIVPRVITEAGDRYFKLAQEICAQLQPPHEDRLNYLVHCHRFTYDGEYQNLGRRVRTLKQYYATLNKMEE